MEGSKPAVAAISLLFGELEFTKTHTATSSALAIICLIETRFRKSEHGGAESEEFMMNTKV